MTAFSAAVSTLNSLMNDQLSGLLVSNNCSSLKGYMFYTYNEFCVKFMSDAAKLGIYFLLLSLVMVAAVVTGSVFAIKYAKVERNKMTVVPQQASTTKLENRDKDSEQSSEFEDLD